LPSQEHQETQSFKRRNLSRNKHPLPYSYSKKIRV
jgi:hypothetical protein